MLRRKTSCSPRKSYRRLTCFFLAGNLYLHLVCLRHVTARQQKNLHVILACMLRDFVTVLTAIHLFSFFSVTDILRTCVYVENECNSYNYTTSVIRAFSCCMIKTIVPCANTQTIVNHLLGAPVHWQKFQTSLAINNDERLAKKKMNKTYRLRMHAVMYM